MNAKMKTEKKKKKAGNVVAGPIRAPRREAEIARIAQEMERGVLRQYRSAPSLNVCAPFHYIP